MSLKLVPAAVLVLALSACASNPPPRDLGRLAFMVGCWTSPVPVAPGENLNLEVWSPSESGLMFGYATTMKDGNLVTWEDSRIDLRNPRATYIASPEGQRAVMFVEAPQPPLAAVQRRLTFTADRTHPGIQGVRHWPRSSPDGSRIATLMRDEAGVIQLWLVSPSGGPPRQLTRDPWDVASAFSWNKEGTAIAYIADGSVMVADAATGESRRLTEPPAADQPAPRPEACVFSPEGRQIAFLRPVRGADGAVWNQIFAVDFLWEGSPTPKPSG